MKVLIPLVLAAPGFLVDLTNVWSGVECWRRGFGPSSVVALPIVFYAYASISFFGITQNAFLWLALGCLWHAFAVFVMHWPAWRRKFAGEGPFPRHPPPSGDT